MVGAGSFICVGGVHLRGGVGLWGRVHLWGELSCGGVPARGRPWCVGRMGCVGRVARHRRREPCRTLLQDVPHMIHFMPVVVAPPCAADGRYRPLVVIERRHPYRPEPLGDQLDLLRPATLTVPRQQAPQLHQRPGPSAGAGHEISRPGEDRPEVRLAGVSQDRTAVGREMGRQPDTDVGDGSGIGVPGMAPRKTGASPGLWPAPRPEPAPSGRRGAAGHPAPAPRPARHLMPSGVHSRLTSLWYPAATGGRSSVWHDAAGRATAGPCTYVGRVRS